MYTRSTGHWRKDSSLGTVLTVLPGLLILYVYWAIVWISMAENWNCLISIGEVLQCLRVKGGESWFGYFYWPTGIQEIGNDCYIQVGFFYVVKNV